MHWWSSLQVWSYKAQKTMSKMRDALRIVWRFLCNNIARMGLQNTPNTTNNVKHAWWCVRGEQSDAFFVKISLQGWAYIQNTPHTNKHAWCIDPCGKQHLRDVPTPDWAMTWRRVLCCFPHGHWWSSDGLPKHTKHMRAIRRFLPYLKHTARKAQKERT